MPMTSTKQANWGIPAQLRASAAQKSEDDYADREAAIEKQSDWVLETLLDCVPRAYLDAELRDALVDAAYRNAEQIVDAGSNKNDAE